MKQYKLKKIAGFYCVYKRRLFGWKQLDNYFFINENVAQSMVDSMNKTNFADVIFMRVILTLIILCLLGIGVLCAVLYNIANS